MCDCDLKKNSIICVSFCQDNDFNSLHVFYVVD